jgi:PHP family Zn ribbon phosphoesterase
MEFIADFHIHSKYSRATSRDMDIKHLADWARLKGVALMGTGDFTHHLWLEELKHSLEDCGNGLYKHAGIYFMLTAEVSSIYSKNGRTYRIHNVIFSPSFKTVDKINERLGRVGNLASDGRPILGLDAEELARIIFDIDENCVIVPGHIWTPWFSLFGSMSGFDRIEDCFGRQTEKIFALETGLSSDPAMNWRLSALDRFTLISNSDSHSPSKIGREPMFSIATWIIKL